MAAVRLSKLTSSTSKATWRREVGECLAFVVLQNLLDVGKQNYIDRFDENANKNYIIYFEKHLNMELKF